jgi:hypothetical protein
MPGRVPSFTLQTIFFMWRIQGLVFKMAGMALVLGLGLPVAGRAQEHWHSGYEHYSTLWLPTELPKRERVKVWDDSLYVIYSTLPRVKRAVGWPRLDNPYDRLDTNWIPDMFEHFPHEQEDDVYLWVKERDEDRRLAWIVIDLLRKGECVVYAKEGCGAPVRCLTYFKFHSGGFETFGYGGIEISRGDYVLFWKLTSMS